MTTIKLNVGGRRFEMTPGTYELLKKNLHSSSISDITMKSPEQEIFFARHADVFQNVLHYYTTGSLHLNHSVCPKLFRTELQHWGIDIEALDKCCYNLYGTFRDDLQSLERYEQYSERASYETPSRKLDRWRLAVWTTLIDPFASTLAQAYFWCSMLVVLLSVVVLCASTDPDVKSANRWADLPSWLQGYLLRHYGPGVYNSTTGVMADGYGQFSQLFVVEMACTILVTIEVVVKLATCPRFKDFFLSCINVIDLCSVIPLYLWLVLDAVVADGPHLSWAERLLELIAILRVCRLFRLARRIRGLRVIMFAVYSSAYDLFLLAIMLVVAMLLFASIIYLADQFTSISQGMWWAIITMTTVGYGDVYPVTAIGRVVGSLCAMTGVLIVALTVPIFVNRFLLYYTFVGKKNAGVHSNSEQKIPHV